MTSEELSGIAEVAVALAGFSGLFAALRRGRGEEFTDSERVALLFMLTLSLGAATLSLAPLPLFAFGLSEPAVWLVACVSLGAFLASVTLWATRTGLRLARVRWLFWAVMCISWGFTALQFAGAATLFGMPRAAVFVAGLWWLVFAAALQFLVQAVTSTETETA